MEEENKKVEVKVIEDFFDHYYGKDRKIGDIFISNAELAFKRKNFAVNGIARPLVEILRVVSDDTPEDEILPNEFKNILNNLFIKTKNIDKIEE